MTRYLDLTTAIAQRIASGDLSPGTALPSLRELALTEQTTPTTVRRAFQELADAGAIQIEPRRTAKVAPTGAVAARAVLRGRRSFRLAGSDDPALSLLTAHVADAITPVSSAGSYRGLSALWSRRADGAALHLRHRNGEYNAPFARGLAWDGKPVLVHLWQREQGIIVPRGNPRGIGEPADLASLRVALRPHGTGTRTLLERLVSDGGGAPGELSGPEVQLHLDVAVAVATGEADAGLGLRATAASLELDFVPIATEPFQVATTEQDAGGLNPLLEALEDQRLRQQVEELGGYDLTGAGEHLPLG